MLAPATFPEYRSTSRWAVRPVLMPPKPDKLSSRSIKKRLAQAFAADGRTWRELSKVLGVHESRVSRWASADPETGALPDPQYLAKITAELEIDANWLLLGDGLMRPMHPSTCQAALARVVAIVDEARDRKR